MPGEERDILLIVDDDAINRAILEQIFADDYVVLEAENGRAGLARILEGPERLCAVLLDVVMPEVDGLEVLRRLSREGLLERTARLLDLPADVVAGVPRVELTGDGELRMENHRGILDYSSEEIHVSGGKLAVRVLGENLELRAMSRTELLITGRIRAVELE